MKKKEKKKSEKERKEVRGGEEKEEEGKSTPFLPSLDWWFSESIREIVRCWTILKAAGVLL